jgi:hypothetical protein
MTTICVVDDDVLVFEQGAFQYLIREIHSDWKLGYRQALDALGDCVQRRRQRTDSSAVNGTATLRLLSMISSPFLQLTGKN